jgi:hypothetical protein
MRVLLLSLALLIAMVLVPFELSVGVEEQQALINDELTDSSANENRSFNRTVATRPAAHQETFGEGQLQKIT